MYFVCVSVSVSVTYDGCAAHEVCVGEVQGGVEEEVGLHDASGSLADVIEETSALHRHSTFVAVLRKKNKIKKARDSKSRKQLVVITL